MSTVILTHPDCLGHATPPGHPEQVARLDAVLNALAPLGIEPQPAPLAAEDDLRRAHPLSYINEVRRAVPESGLAQLDADTFLTPGSVAAATRAVGAAVKGVDLVMSGAATNVFCAVRPPGHHAERDRAMGFCLFGTVAIAAKHALEHHGLSRVAILDFDVHHGNGTQDICEDDARIFFASSHQMPLYPGTGYPSETGVADNVMNVALPDGAGSAPFRAAWKAILHKARAFEPELVIISAGFDAHADDPLAGLMVETEDFAWVTEQICDLARDCCEGRVVSCLEGGYDLGALADCAAAHVTVLKEHADD